MKIAAENIKKFDFIAGLGKVEDIMMFYSQEAIRNRTQEENKFIATGAEYARLVAEQQEQLYKKTLDRVVVTIGGKQKTYFAKDEVEVYRINNIAA
jgi:hypothetical protein